MHSPTYVETTLALVEALQFVRHFGSMLLSLSLNVVEGQHVLPSFNAQVDVQCCSGSICGVYRHQACANEVNNVHVQVSTYSKACANQVNMVPQLYRHST